MSCLLRDCVARVGRAGRRERITPPGALEAVVGEEAVRRLPGDELAAGEGLAEWLARCLIEMAEEIAITASH
jgi:hypothetical protein